MRAHKWYGIGRRMVIVTRRSIVTVLIVYRDTDHSVCLSYVYLMRPFCELVRSGVI